MANPQKEHGFTAIANEILEALARIGIPGEARRMLDVIIRKTYGYNKKVDKISTSQFMELTGLSRSKVYRARRKLKEMNLITIYKKGDSQTLTYCLQKDYDKWKSPKKDTVYKNVDRYLHNCTKTVYIEGTHNRKKDNIQKKEASLLPYIQKIIELYKQLKGYDKQADWDKYHFKRHTRAAKELYEMAGDDSPEAMEWVSKQRYADWTLETVIKKLPDYRKSKQQQSLGAAGRVLDD